ncbi:hypothetical protein ACFXKC_31485 [Streptomyces sp. NPDC059340]|uniref:hypothetical protein n=1 Tax=Streptomyces sp. NPDC059340 TaxID=3346806 RepID=UPI0036B867D9
MAGHTDARGGGQGGGVSGCQVAHLDGGGDGQILRTEARARVGDRRQAACVTLDRRAYRLRQVVVESGGERGGDRIPPARHEPQPGEVQGRELGVWGEQRRRVDHGTPVRLSGTKIHTVLGTLLLARGRSVTYEQLGARLWGCSPSSSTHAPSPSPPKPARSVSASATASVTAWRSTSASNGPES